MTSLKQAILEWDNKSSDQMHPIFKQYSLAPDFIDDLLPLISDVECQQGASWLLKAWLKNGQKLSHAHTTMLWQSLTLLKNWESKLHILQGLPYLNISLQDKPLVVQFLRITLSDHNKFVRAWTYNGFYILSQQYPEYKKETEQLFEMAMRDEPASVKARIRNVVKGK